MHEVLAHYAAGIEASEILSELSLVPGNYFIVSAHREENVDAPETLRRLLAVLNALAERYGMPVIVSTHPRTRKRLADLGESAHELVSFLKPFGFLDYVKLQKEARAVLSDSGTITEESSIMNFPALNLREVHERPEGFEEASVMMVGLDRDRVLEGIEILRNQARGDERDLRLVADYEPDNTSEKMVRIVLSYTGFIDRRTWRKAPAVSQ